MSRKRQSAVREQDIPLFQNQRKNKQSFYLNESKTIDFSQAQRMPKVNKRPVVLVPKSLNQEKYILALLDQDTDIVVVSGPAGAGKTFLGILAAIKALRAGECERIVLCRPAISVEGEDHGFLPGDLNSKLEPWVRPMLDILREFYTSKELESMLSEHVIEFAPLGFMRGRTFKNAYIVLDESQNSTPDHMLMLLTRIGLGTKIIIAGDTEQSDRRVTNNGLLDLVRRLEKHPIPGVTSCVLDSKDIQRHHIITDIIKLYN